MLISPYARIRVAKQTVNGMRYNSIILKRKLRIASFVPAPRLIKTFHNNPVSQ
jgi:hypothetical protein